MSYVHRTMIVAEHLQKTVVDSEGVATKDAQDVTGLAALCVEHKVKATKTQIRAFIGALDVTEGTFDQALPRLGLKLIRKIDLSNATADELALIPGVGKAMANTIIAARPIAGLANMDALSGAGPALMKTLTEWSTT